MDLILEPGGHNIPTDTVLRNSKRKLTGLNSRVREKGS